MPDRALTMASRIADSVSGKDLDETLAGLTRAAVEMLPGVDQATITIRHEDGRPRSYGLTADFLGDLDDWQFENAEGPCYDGVTENAFIVCADLRHDPRYPTYGPRAVAAGIRSQAGVRLFESPRTVGGLNIYSRSVGALADVTFLAELFAEHARSAVSYASQIDGLRDAMRRRQLIGQAVGITMERFGLPDEHAFAFLTRLSNHRNVKLHVIAQEIIDDAADRRD
ncbi:GAF and ANTAR domain-containing protein [Nocardioides KLBMP 9356]|uniref:GAF and ANTAR domain-containing protein n=1 Tax=Nocardioides potassii TaxID=2911371 RepID=A0ABS9HFL4_9ACTN|nr:GAF and ANTAR domain-containing protein [Nocardioides potassii]MCF6379922.1 GAF and ANTAR domain-containing protein [Nocardioides potassii]